MDKISGFFGEYRFLSNFWAAPIDIGSIIFPTNEHAYQAAKSLQRHEWALILDHASPGRAKKVGRQLTLRPDWEEIKLEVMREITRCKYDQHPDLKEKLMATKGIELVEYNTWGDVFWGVCGNAGQNHLGKILMEYRDQALGQPEPSKCDCEGIRNNPKSKGCSAFGCIID
jgi:ribA/ribD-fused uncharacterized protein